MEGTYEYELERAELLGVDPITKEQWEEQMKARKEVELEEEQTEIASELEAEGEKLKGTHGKMDELNSILSATQFRLNKFKTVCGSFTSLLKIRTGSPAPPEDRASTSGQGSINEALDNLDTMKKVEQQSDAQFAMGQAQEIGHQVEKNLGALDRLIAKAENAELSLNRQNQQMKGLLKK